MKFELLLWSRQLERIPRLITTRWWTMIICEFSRNILIFQYLKIFLNCELFGKIKNPFDVVNIFWLFLCSLNLCRTEKSVLLPIATGISKKLEHTSTVQHLFLSSLVTLTVSALQCIYISYHLVLFIWLINVLN